MQQAAASEWRDWASFTFMALCATIFLWLQYKTLANHQDEVAWWKSWYLF
jgi:hypothetical protein